MNWDDGFDDNTYPRNCKQARIKYLDEYLLYYSLCSHSCNNFQSIYLMLQ